MIRDYKETDKASMTKILKKGFEVLNQEDLEFLFCRDNRIMVFEDEKEGVIGFNCFGRWGLQKENGKMFLYVIPEFRRRRVGSLLFDLSMEYAGPLQLNLIEALFRVDYDDATPFYLERGFKKWYGLHTMRYNGGECSTGSMKIVPYEDCFFEQYIESMRGSFFEMRQANDFKPYNCVDFSEKQRNELQKDKENLFVLVIDGSFAASAAVHTESSDVLGPVFVAPSFQGKGYGKIITQFAINEALHRGLTTVSIEVVEWNKRAIKMYEGLGFENVQTTNSYRLMLP